MEKPIEVTTVRAEPTYSGGAVFADKEENWAESPTTVKPQINMLAINNTNGKLKKEKDNKLHKQEINNILKATLALPHRVDQIPPNIHPRLPMPMIKKHHNEIETSIAIWSW